MRLEMNAYSIAVAALVDLLRNRIIMWAPRGLHAPYRFGDRPWEEQLQRRGIGYSRAGRLALPDEPRWCGELAAAPVRHGDGGLLRRASSRPRSSLKKTEVAAHNSTPKLILYFMDFVVI
jgi:hypothetical protein